MSDANTTNAVLTHDGKVLIEQVDGSYRLATSRTDWDQVNALSEEEVEAAALPEAPSRYASGRGSSRLVQSSGSRVANPHERRSEIV
jgi:hypothetical protein